MYKHILIPTDGSAVADKAVEAGIEFAREAQAQVTLFTAVAEYEVPTAGELMSRRASSLSAHEELSRRKADAILGPAQSRARAAGVACDTDFVLDDRPYHAIIEAAKRHGCDAIFMSTHARQGLAKLWYGSETVEVLEHSDIPTLVYR
ncbi:MAG: UspA domain protein [Burkholderiales bacterium]|jgi:nucleotide-binding universal stress UspA family protein|nr:UspA domain protein [Burkholderiales bacterium]